MTIEYVDLTDYVAIAAAVTGLDVATLVFAVLGLCRWLATCSAEKNPGKGHAYQASDQHEWRGSGPLGAPWNSPVILRSRASQTRRNDRQRSSQVGAFLAVKGNRDGHARRGKNKCPDVDDNTDRATVQRGKHRSGTSAL